MQIFRFAMLALTLLTATQIVHSAESPREKIAFAYAAVSPSMAGIWMAKEIGAFERNGLNAELVHMSFGATAIQAFVGGSVQAAPGASNAVALKLLEKYMGQRGGSSELHHEFVNKYLDTVPGWNRRRWIRY